LGHPMTKTDILLSPYMCHHILFHVGWRVAVYNSWIVAVDFLFPSLFFSLLAGNVQHCFFYFILFNSSPHSLNLVFSSFFLFIEVFVYFQFIICIFFNFSHHSFNFLFLSYFLYRSFFQFSPSIAISHMFCFLFWSFL
jgi:hypothetical protein